MSLHRYLVLIYGVISNLVLCSAWANIDIRPEDMGSESIDQPAKRIPCSFNTYVDVIGSSRIDKGFFKGDRVHFAEAEADLGCLFYYCPAYTEGARIALGYTATYLRWSENPCFNQDHFYTVSLILDGFTQRINRWFWRTQCSINFDPKQWNAPYTSYDFLLWGRYHDQEDLGIHLGFVAETGLRLDRIWPIFGVDWKISPQWKLNLVFPVDISLEYAISPCWSLALAGRVFDFRHRVHQHETLVRYENYGAEFAIKYSTLGLNVNLHAGVTLGGKYRIANRYNHHANNFILQPSGYIGCEAEVTF